MVCCCCRCLEEGAQAQVMWTITEKDDMIPEGKKEKLSVFYTISAPGLFQVLFPSFFFGLDLSLFM